MSLTEKFEVNLLQPSSIKHKIKFKKRSAFLPATKKPLMTAVNNSNLKGGGGQKTDFS